MPAFDNPRLVADRRVLSALWGGAGLFVVAVALAAAALLATQQATVLSHAETRVTRFVPVPRLPSTAAFWAWTCCWRAWPSPWAKPA